MNMLIKILLYTLYFLLCVLSLGSAAVFLVYALCIPFCIQSFLLILCAIIQVFIFAGATRDVYIWEKNN